MQSDEIQAFWNKKYSECEQNFVTYQELTAVEELDKYTDNERFSILPSTGNGVIGKYISKFRDMENTIPNVIVRETVYEKLCRVDKALKQKNPNYQLVVTYGYRSLDIQKEIFDKRYNELKRKYDDPSELKEAVHRIIAAPEVAGHPTGGAVDVIIYDMSQNKYLDFGTAIHDFTTKKAYYDTPELGEKSEAKRNRRMLRSLMGKQDFVPYDGEWWHFSYGDKEWAYYKYRKNKRKNKKGNKESLELKYKYSQKDFSEIFFADMYTDKYKKVELVSDVWIRLAVQKDGRLTEETLTMLQVSGIEVNFDKRQFLTRCSNFPLEILFVRDDDIPQFVYSGVADIGIVGENVYYESEKESLTILKQLGFGRCTLALAVPNDSIVKKPSDLEGKRIATSYPILTKKFFGDMGVKIQEPRPVSGSVEITPAIDFADAIVDLVSSGTSLRQNNLRFVQKILDSQSVLIANKSIIDNNDRKTKVIDNLLSKIDSCLSARKYKYIIMNLPVHLLKEMKDKIYNEVKNIKHDFMIESLDDKLLVQFFLLNTDIEYSQIAETLENILPGLKFSLDGSFWEKIRNCIFEIKNRRILLSENCEKRQVQIIVDTTLPWEIKLKEIGATDIIVLDVERFVK